MGYIDKKDYKASVDSSVLLLKGETKTLFNKLEKDMIRASNSKNYELAANIEIILAYFETLQIIILYFLKIAVLILLYSFVQNRKS